MTTSARHHLRVTFFARHVTGSIIDAKSARIERFSPEPLQRRMAVPAISRLASAICPASRDLTPLAAGMP
nr:hypothetical protein BOH68_06070 [Cobetia sp. MM1IDA2H-1]